MMKKIVRSLRDRFAAIWPPEKEVELLVTLLPSFPHFRKFAFDSRLSAIRINSAMLTVSDVEKELALIPKRRDTVPMYFDIKGRQLRVTEVHDSPDFLDISLNHPILVQTPTTILFKAGEDHARLREISGDGYRLKFFGGPRYMVKAGESICIRDASLQVLGAQFVEAEIKKIAKVKAAGLTRWFLSYVESQRDVDEFLELVGKHTEVMLKIESKKGLEYVAREFKKRDNLRLVAAKGDMYVELDRPDQILQAQRLIIERDPEANAGSRMMLSVVNKIPEAILGPDGEPIINRGADGKPHVAFKWKMDANSVPSDADFEQVAWLYDIGYRSFMLCDEMCLHENLLVPAVNAMQAFKENYTS